MLKHLDLSQFTLNEKMYIENANIQNCKISEIQNRICVISKCNFYNVVFENSFYEVYATFKECKFIKCMFRDTFEGEDLELLVKDNIFIDCVFENISYRSFQVQSNVTYSKFVNCNFSNIKITFSNKYNYVVEIIPYYENEVLKFKEKIYQKK